MSETIGCGRMNALKWDNYSLPIIIHNHLSSLRSKSDLAEMGLLCVILSLIMMKQGGISEGKIHTDCTILITNLS